MALICPECQSENSKDSRFCNTCGTAIESKIAGTSLTQTIVPPESLSDKRELFAGRYQILALLGKGGMGDVYRVHDTKLQEDMALKLLRLEIAKDSDIIQRFRNELKLARKITHRNVCRVFDFHEEKGTPFITMEYVEGDNLKSLIKKTGKLKESVALKYAIQICEGLAEAHKLGVVHRDLKPQNVMIDPDGQAKVMDFGIARSIHASELTQTGQMIGTPDYISPEQAAGQPADRKADIYALGVILYEMTTGMLPFKGDTALSVITKHREEKVKQPRDIDPELSEGLNRLILKCMEKARDFRYQSVRELLNDLYALSEGKRLISSPKKSLMDLFRGKKWIGYLAAVALVLIASVILFKQNRKQGPVTGSEPERPSLAVVYFENNTGDEGLSHWRKAFAELLTADLSQSRYLNVLSGDRVYKILSDLGQLESSGYSSDVLRQVAQKGNVRHILRGSYIKAGSKFRISISLQDMKTGELIGSQTAEADGEENLFALVDRLTVGIKADMNLTPDQISGDFDEEAADVMTSSPEAYKYYVEGLRYHYRAEYQTAIEFMDKAIAIDPDFASAWGWKAFSYDSLGYQQEFVAAMKKTYELSHMVSERERFRLVAYYHMRVEGDAAKSLAELQKFISLYPEDIFAHHQLGTIYFNTFEEYEKAIGYLRYNVDNRIEMFYSYYVMAWAEMCLGHYDRAQEVCEIYINEISDHPEIRFSLAVNYLCRGEYDRALSEIDKVEELGFSATFWIDLFKGAILQAKGDLTEAAGHYRNMAGSRDVLIGTLGREYLSALAFLQGRYQEAKSQISQAIDLVEAAGDEANMSRLYTHLAYLYLQTAEYKESLEASSNALVYCNKSMDIFNAVKLVLHIKGLSLLAMGNLEAVLETAEELKAAAERDPGRETMCNYLHLLGSIAMKKGDMDDAVRYFTEAVSLLPAQNQNDLAGFKNNLRRTMYLSSLVEAHFAAGDWDKARTIAEELTALTIGRQHWADLYVKGFFWLGKISEEQDKPDEAVSFYRKFLELWKDSDPGIEELAQAQKRLAILIN